MQQQRREEAERVLWWSEVVFFSVIAYLSNDSQFYRELFPGDLFPSLSLFVILARFMIVPFLILKLTQYDFGVFIALFANIVVLFLDIMAWYVCAFYYALDHAFNGRHTQVWDRLQPHHLPVIATLHSIFLFIYLYKRHV